MQTEIVTRAEALVALGKATSLSESEDALLNMIKPMAENAVRQYLQTGITQQTYTHILPLMTNPLDIRDGWEGWPHRSVYAEGLAFTGTRGLQLPDYPIRSMTSLHEDRSAFGGTASGAFASTSLLTEGTDYYRDLDQSGLCMSGILYRISTAWYSRPGSYQAIYLAGWSEAELRGNVSDWRLDASDIRLSVMQTIVETFNDMVSQQASQGGSGGSIKSERLGDYAVAYDTSSFGATVAIPPDAKERLERFKKAYTMVM